MEQDMNKMMEEYGITSDAPKIKNTGTVFHVFEVGGYTALVGKFKLTYVNAEKKKCEKDEPGAKAAYGMLDLIIAKTPDETVIIDKNYQINTEVDYGVHIFRQYVSLDSDKQYFNKLLFTTFTIENTPIAVIEEDNGEFITRLGSLPAFIGIPCTFDIIEGKKKGARFLENLTLKTNTLSKKLLESRTKVVETLYAEILKKKPVKKNKDDEPMEDVGNPEDLMNDAGDDVLNEFNT
jgi:hypothetical protein